MLHKAPEKQELNERLDGLKQKYESLKGRGVNPARIKLIELIQSFRESSDREYNHQAALGICIYGLLKVGKGFDLFYGEKKTRHYHFFGSELGPLIQDCIDITYFNPLNEQNALIYLTHLYHHLKKHPRKIDGSEGDELDAEEILKEIGGMIKKLLERLATKRPTYNAIINNFASIPEKYRELGGTDTSRDRYAQFIKILNEDFKEKYNNSDSKEDREWTEAYSIRYGAMLYNMDKINAEYTFLSPKGTLITKGSHLYQACMPALNINDPADVPDDIKRKYYIDFLSYVFRITLQPKELELWENKYHFPNARQFFEELQNGLAERVVELMKGGQPGAVSLSYFDIISSATATYVVTIGLGEVATQVRLSGTALKYFSLLKPETALMITLMAFALNAVITQKAATAINKAVVTGVSTTIMGTFDGLDKLGNYCIGLFHPERSLKATGLVDNADFNQALHMIPDDIFTSPLKQKMQFLTAYQAQEHKAAEVVLMPVQGIQEGVAARSLAH